MTDRLLLALVAAAVAVWIAGIVGWALDPNPGCN